MKLFPLQQWICDTCGELIEKPEEGYLQFHRNEQTNELDDIIVVHHFVASPLKYKFPYNNPKGPEGCYKHDLDLDLPHYLGTAGMTRLLNLIDTSSLLHTDNTAQERVNIRKWVEMVRRLHIPYYEEARTYWDAAKRDGFFDGCSRIWPYTEESLKKVIQKYRPVE